MRNAPSSPHRVRRDRKSREFPQPRQLASLLPEGPSGRAWEVPRPARCLLGCEEGRGGRGLRRGELSALGRALAAGQAGPRSPSWKREMRMRGEVRRGADRSGCGGAWGPRARVTTYRGGCGGVRGEWQRVRVGVRACRPASGGGESGKDS